MTLRFGTDGVRGLANGELTPELVLALGRAAARVLGPGPHLVGRDTRRSGQLLQAALTAGLLSEGADVVDLGVVPTPAVAHAATRLERPAAMISASHNPFADNGVKLFAPGGRKLSDTVEAAVEEALAAVMAGGAAGAGRPTGAGVGAATTDDDAGGAWADHVVATLDGRRLDGMVVVLDCANGAAALHAPGVLRGLGATVTVLADAPDGANINDGCGSTHPEALQRAVVAVGADVGLALDGDADRVLAVDARGQVVDGDQVIALCALDLRARGRLHDDTVVVTVMTNLGFHTAMTAHAIRVHEVAVGDRAVLEALEEHGWSLGGEQSGHVIFRDVATTGDGTLTGVALLDLVHRAGRPLADLAAAAMTRLPQVLRNVLVADRAGLEGATAVWREVAAVERELGGAGRVLLRPSGTEPLVRVMVEAATPQAASAAADRLSAAVLGALGTA